MQVQQYTKSNHEVHGGVPFSHRLRVKRGRQYMYSTTISPLKTQISEKTKSTDTKSRSTIFNSIVYRGRRKKAYWHVRIKINVHKTWMDLPVSCKICVEVVLFSRPVMRNHDKASSSSVTSFFLSFYIFFILVYETAKWFKSSHDKK